MRKLWIIGALLAVAAVTAAVAANTLAWKSSTKALPGAAGSLYDFTLTDIEGEPQPLKEYEGKVVVIVNTASRCGLTPQYEGLEALYQKYKDKGLVVLGFPANEFGNQEPGTNEEIAEFCSTKYDVTFPMFSKIVVKGNGMHPLYKWLVASTGGADIEWNFAKFVIGRDGKIVKRFAPRVTPSDATFIETIEQELTK